jgi:hypothetical protein
VEFAIAMSLKHFHLFFVTVCGLGSLGLGLWFLLTEKAAEIEGAKIMGIVSLVCFVALVIYGVKFWKLLSREEIK